MRPPKGGATGQSHRTQPEELAFSTHLENVNDPWIHTKLARTLKGTCCKTGPMVGPNAYTKKRGT